MPIRTALFSGGDFLEHKYIDLHCHSYYSDGTYSPEGLVLLAKQKGLCAIALTDHDTIDGLALFHEAGKKHGLETISGIEFAVFYTGFGKKVELHIVGLDFNPLHPALQDAITFIQESRDARNKKIIDNFRRRGMPMTLEEVEKNAGGLIVTRAHFANVLVARKYANNKAEAFEKYISPGLPCYVERELLSPKDCIELIRNIGGVAVLAHPTKYSLNMEQLETVCMELKEYGLSAVEVTYSTYTAAQERDMKKLADKYQLAYSGGSDFHGENKPDIQLGVGHGNLKIPYSYLVELQSASFRKGR